MRLKEYLSQPPLLSKPWSGEDLYLYLVVSNAAVSAVLFRKEEGVQLPVYYVSRSMVPAETRYPNMEKLALALLVASRKLLPYFQAYFIIIYTSYPLRQVLHRPKTSGCLMRWSIELNQYEIRYLPRASIKGQMVADFIVKLAPTKEDEIQPGPNSMTTKLPPNSHLILPWKLYVDGSSNDHGCGAGLILTSPGLEHLRTEYALWLGFRASNNEAEYEALLTGLRLAKVVGVHNLHIFSDSQLVVGQVLQEYQAKEKRIVAYLAKVRNHMLTFEA